MHDPIDVNVRAPSMNGEKEMKESHTQNVGTGTRKSSGGKSSKAAMGLVHQAFMRAPGGVNKSSRGMGMKPILSNEQIQRQHQNTRPSGPTTAIGKRKSVVDLMPPLSAAGSSHQHRMMQSDSSHSSRSSMMEKQIQIKQQIQHQQQNTRPNSTSNDKRKSVVDLMPPLSAAGASTHSTSTSIQSRSSRAIMEPQMQMQQQRQQQQQQRQPNKPRPSLSTTGKRKSVVDLMPPLSAAGASTNSASTQSKSSVGMIDQQMQQQQQQQQQQQNTRQIPPSRVAETSNQHHQHHSTQRQKQPSRRNMIQQAGTQQSQNRIGMGVGMATSNVSSRGLGISTDSSQQQSMALTRNNSLRGINQTQNNKQQQNRDPESSEKSSHSQQPQHQQQRRQPEGQNRLPDIAGEKNYVETDEDTLPPLQPKHKKKLQQKLERVRNKLKRKGSQNSISSASSGKRSLKYEVNDATTGVSPTSREDFLLCSFPSSRSAARLGNVSSHAPSDIIDEENKDDDEDEQEETLFEDFPTFRQNTFREEEDEDDEDRRRVPEQKNSHIQQMEEEFDSRKPWRKAPTATVEQRSKQPNEIGSSYHKAESTYSIDLYAGERDLFDDAGRIPRGEEDFEGDYLDDSDLSDPSNHRSCSDVFELLQAEEALELMQDVPRKEPAALTPYKSDSINRKNEAGNSGNNTSVKNNIKPSSQKDIQGTARRNHSLQRQNSDDSTFTSGSESDGNQETKRSNTKNRGRENNKGKSKDRDENRNTFNKGKGPKKTGGESKERSDRKEPNRPKGSAEKEEKKLKGKRKSRKSEESSGYASKAGNLSTTSSLTTTITNNKKGTKKSKKKPSMSIKQKKEAPGLVSTDSDKSDNSVYDEEEAKDNFNSNIFLGMSIHSKADSMIDVDKPAGKKDRRPSGEKLERKGSQINSSFKRQFSSLWTGGMWTQGTQSVRNLVNPVQDQGAEVEAYWGNEEKKKGRVESFMGPFAWEHRWKILIGVLVVVIILSVAIPLASGSKDEKTTELEFNNTTSPPASSPSSLPLPPPTSAPILPPTTAADPVFIEVQAISGSSASDNTGSSVSFSSDGTYLAVGSRSATGNAQESGTVVVYELSDGFWSRLGMTIEGVGAQEMFGTSVSIADDGRRLVAGAPRGGEDGEKNGVTRVFEYDENTLSWNQLGDTIKGIEDKSLSGFAVAMSGNGQRVAIGEPRTGDDNGSVRTFEFDGDNWVPVGEAIAGLESREFFGYSVSMSREGDMFATGARVSARSGMPNSGSVSVFQLVGVGSAGTWEQRGSDINGEATGNLAGHSVSITADGSRVAIGSVGHDSDKGEGVGQCRVFDFKTTENVFGSDNADWIQIGSGLEGNLPGERSGTSVSISADGTKIACGGASGDDNGVVRVYDDFNNTWTQIGDDLLSAPGSSFGSSVSLTNDGEFLAVGAPKTKLGQFESVGQVVVYGYI